MLSYTRSQGTPLCGLGRGRTMPVERDSRVIVGAAVEVGGGVGEPCFASSSRLVSVGPVDASQGVNRRVWRFALQRAQLWLKDLIRLANAVSKVGIVGCRV